MSRRKLTKTQQQIALREVAKWLGPRMGSGHGCGRCEDCRAGRDYLCERWLTTPAPTGPEAAYNGSGPQLLPEWDWPSEPTPTIVLEGGPYDWAIEIGSDEKFAAMMTKHGIFAEPWAGWALCLYRED